MFDESFQKVEESQKSDLRKLMLPRLRTIEVKNNGGGSGGSGSGSGKRAENVVGSVGQSK